MTRHRIARAFGPGVPAGATSGPASGDGVATAAELAEFNRHLLDAREDERSHLARELHDELGALLTAAKLDAARLGSQLGGHMPEARERLARLVRTLDLGIALKRRIVEDLRPSALAQLGLVATLEILVGEFAGRAGLAVGSDLAPVTLDAEGELVVYRLVQEATTNIARHARAHRVSLVLREVPGDGGREVLLRIGDDGIGFDAGRPTFSAHGLAGMRWRVQSRGGRMRVQSRPDDGTTIEVWLPVTPAAG